MGLEATPAPVYRRKQIRDQHSVSLSRRGSLFWKILFHTPVPGFFPRAAPDGSVRGLVRREELCFFVGYFLFSALTTTKNSVHLYRLSQLVFYFSMKEHDDGGWFHLVRSVLRSGGAHCRRMTCSKTILNFNAFEISFRLEIVGIDRLKLDLFLLEDLFFSLTTSLCGRNNFVFVVEALVESNFIMLFWTSHLCKSI